ncbi:MAG TPA: hypothetical protein VG733_19285 [Chthoniobacteraceae bacterium]|nr:hypothetical protein [Chthoniobacteraceae bacterium]
MKRKPAQASKPEKSPVTRERLRIARVLHEGICQTLCGAQFLAQVLTTRAEREGRSTREEKELLRVISSAVRETQLLHRQLQTRKKKPRS